VRAAAEWQDTAQDDERRGRGKDGGGQTTFAQAATSPNDNPWRIDYGKIMSVYGDWETDGVFNRPDDEIMSNIRRSTTLVPCRRHNMMRLLTWAGLKRRRAASLVYM